MKIAIHHRKGSFSDRWISYCKDQGIDFKIVNAYDTDIINQVSDCDAFMWHFHHADYRDVQFAKALILSLETKGIRCFPDGRTCWHFDNKVWEKYLLEAIDAPLVPSYVFYTKEEAFKWVASTEFPKVFKLKGGAGASNVKLVHTRKEAEQLINQCFTKGFSQYRWQDQLKEEWRMYKEGKVGLRNVVRPLYFALKPHPTEFSHFQQKEMGYAYFQDFIPNNQFDLRVVVIGDKAIGEKRHVRKGDFRASGSGEFEYVPLGEDVLSVAFNVARRLHLQSVAFDFIYRDKEPLIVEISYGFGTHGISHCKGYYTNDMQWHPEPEPDFCGWMVDSIFS